MGFDHVTLWLGIVCSTNAPVGIMIVRAGPERYFLFHAGAENIPSPLAKNVVFQISKQTVADEKQKNKTSSLSPSLTLFTKKHIPHITDVQYHTHCERLWDKWKFQELTYDTPTVLSGLKRLTRNLAIRIWALPWPWNLYWEITNAIDSCFLKEGLRCIKNSLATLFKYILNNVMSYI